MNLNTLKLDSFIPKLCLYRTVLSLLTVTLCACGRTEFTEREKNILDTLSLDKLRPPVSVSNRVATDKSAQLFGEQLFNDKGLSSSGNFSCASCHDPDNYFIDGLPTGVAQEKTDRNTPALHGVAWQSWFYWDGRRDSLWSQALTPIEAAKEMASDRVAAIRHISASPEYRSQYEAIFGTLPFQSNDAKLSVSATPIGNKVQKQQWNELPTDLRESINIVFSNIGKAIGAYQHTLAPIKTRFDLLQQEVAEGRNIKNITSLSKLELEGALLFLNEEKTQCLECHNGPLLSNGNFHNIGTGNFTGPVYDFGREFGSQSVLLDEFNCQGRFSDARPDECLHLIYLNRDASHARGAFKTPTLRNVPNTGPFFHDGRFTTMEQIVRHYSNPPFMEQADPHELRADFALDEKEVKALSAFLRSFEPAE